ncbi:MAG TPA: methyltransferase domain-containing protein [Caulobacteraceae bacterium]|nr:methyltransferase domain-containing protein [Caulobacteraceae bacterium]
MRGDAAASMFFAGLDASIRLAEQSREEMKPLPTTKPQAKPLKSRAVAAAKPNISEKALQSVSRGPIKDKNDEAVKFLIDSLPNLSDSDLKLKKKLGPPIEPQVEPTKSRDVDAVQPRISEKALQTDSRGLMRDHKNAQAVKFLIDSLPSLSDSDLIVKEKLSQTTEPQVEPTKSRAGAAAQPKFSEKALQSDIRALIKERKIDQAVKFLIDSLPSLSASNLNVKEKLSNLYFLMREIEGARESEGGGGLKYGYRKLLSKIKNLNSTIGDVEVPPNGGFVELGCGAHDPLALSTYFYLNGYEPNFGVDLLSPRVPEFSASSMYDILANMKMFPGRYCRGGTRPKDVLDRLRAINTASFERGDFDLGLQSMRGIVDLELVDIVKSRIPPNSISLLASFAVFEHVDDIDAVSRHIHGLLKPGGVAYHLIDLADHRSYRGDGIYGPLSFLTEEEAPANMNRLRAPQMTEAQARAGFEILRDVRISAPFPAGFEDQLVSRFRAMPLVDVTVVKQHLLVRKPA